MTYPSLVEQFNGSEIVVAPGVFDGLSATLAARAGFSAAYLTGSGIAYCRFGKPDIGLISMSEVAETLSVIRECIEVPLIVDADTGYGNALNVQRTVRLFERCGANAIQLEDQTNPKRCGHLTGKSLVSTAEFVGKIKAATDARTSETTLIMARTDAIAVEGFEPALERAERYLEAGADILFIEAPRTEQEMRAVCAQFQERVPLLANMVEGGFTPMYDAAQLQEFGFKLVIFPGGTTRARSKTEMEYFASLKAHGWNQPFRDRMLDLTELNMLLDTDRILETGAQYDAEYFQYPKRNLIRRRQTAS
jgi:2-methylisocitrate lyase-like PEP mutase family enzyme